MFNGKFMILFVENWFGFVGFVGFVFFFRLNVKIDMYQFTKERTASHNFTLHCIAYQRSII